MAGNYVKSYAGNGSTVGYRYGVNTGGQAKQQQRNYLRNNTKAHGGIASSDNYRWKNGATGAVYTGTGRQVAAPYSSGGSSGGGGGYSGGSSGGGNDYAADSGGGGAVDTGPSLADILAELRRQQQEAAKAAMDAANGQIDASLQQALQRYGRQRDNATADYQSALNTSELNRFWAGKNLRETQANRGLLDSGAGRQDRLFMDSNYNNNVTKILNERAKAYQDIDNAIANARLQADNTKASNYANYMAANASGMSSILSALMSGYAGNVSDLTTSLANFNQIPTASVQNAMQNTPTLANILAAYDDDNQAYTKKNTNYVY